MPDREVRAKIESSIVGKTIKITDKKHPHYGESGVVRAIQTTYWGEIGIRVDLNNGGGCFVFPHHKYEIGKR